MDLNTHTSTSVYKKIMMLVCVVGLILIGGKSMAFGKVNLSSEMQGTLLENGQPLPNVKVTRSLHWQWGDETFTETTTTNQQGRFSFPAKTASTFTAKIIPHEPVIEQKIVFTNAGKDYEGWIYAKHNYDDLVDLQGKALIFSCELTSEPEYRKTYGLHGAYGICDF